MQRETPSSPGGGGGAGGHKHDCEPQLGQANPPGQSSGGSVVGSQYAGLGGGGGGTGGPVPLPFRGYGQTDVSHVALVTTCCPCIMHVHKQQETRLVIDKLSETMRQERERERERESG